MIAFKVVRKIGKILRGGAGRKEILLGMLCGVLIGFNPGVNMMLALAILITLLLNANVAFVLLGAALGKVLCLALAPVTFHTGYFIIHSIGMEGLFRSLCNAPVTALMDLNVYAMVGSLPYALVVGIVAGLALGSAVVGIRKKMLAADQHEIIGKAFGNKFARLLLRLAFGKSKLSLDDEVPKQSPLFRKSGLILTGVVVLIALVLEFFLLDMTVKKGLQSAISTATGAEVNIDRAHLSLLGGELELENLQVTDPDKPTHNLMQLETLAVDTSIQDLLRKSYVVERMVGDTLKRDVLRDKPGEVYAKAEEEKAEEEAEAEKDGKALGDYLAKAKELEKYGKKAREYLKNRKDNAEAIANGEKPVASKEAAVADAKNLGYLKAAADLVADRPTWTVRKLEIHNVQLGGDYPPYLFSGAQLSSHPELNGKPTILSMKPADSTEATGKLVLRFDSPDAQHALSMNLEDIALGDKIETSDSFPVNINDGKADLKADGKFAIDVLQIPFTVNVHNLKADVEEGQTVMGMDSETATEVFSSIEQLEIEGLLTGSLDSPRVKIDYDKLTANIKQALLAAGKKELANRANAELDKAKEQAKE
ncbi:MAG: hypothetical protein ABFR33_10760, partial [Verrucomicrobiota bacterium]